MAKKKKTVNTTPRYYVYYDKKTKEILSVTNEKSPTYKDGIEVNIEEIENFLNGNWKFKDYYVDYLKNSTTLSIIANADQGYSFKNNEYDWIKEHDDHATCIVEWNGPNQCWNFILDSGYKKVSSRITVPTLMFFVTLESDFDFLIRNIHIDVNELYDQDAVTIPFESNFEQHVDKISISSKLTFKDYKLRIINE